MPASAKKEKTNPLLNGIDVGALGQVVREVSKDSSKGLTRWMVSTQWMGGTRSETRVRDFEIGGQRVPKDFKISSDEPLELLGTNQNANPQELLMAAFNACMTVGYVALASLEGIEIEDLRIETEGEIDLRGFLGLDPNVKPGYEEISYRVHIKGNGTPEQFQKIHEGVIATSPNRFNLANPIRLNSRLIVE